MNRFIKRIAISSALVAMVAVPAAWAAGLWSTLPIAGGAAFCASTSTLFGGQGCTQTVPAGPLPALTGAELFPADTGLGNTGGVPATEVVTTCQLGGGSYNIYSPIVSPYAGTVPNQVCWYVISSTTTIAAFSLTMPAAPLDGQILHISSTVAITQLTMTANTGQTLNGAQTSASANTAIGVWIYNGVTKTWYKA